MVARKKITKPKKEPIEKKRCLGTCKEEKPINQFYNSKNKFFADGKMPICKKCIKETIDYTNIETVYEILQQLDVPFLYEPWMSSVSSPRDTFGAYITKINSLPQYDGLIWKDSIFTSEDGLKVGQSQEDALQEEYTTKLTYNGFWKGNYTQEDLDYLNNYLKSLKADFKIITVNHMDYAKKIAKTSLLMDKAYEDILAGVSGADKRFNDLQKTFDALSKSAQFSENTRGANDVTLGAFGLIFEQVEERRWVPQHIPLEKDDIDKMIEAFTCIEKSV